MLYSNQAAKIIAKLGGDAKTASLVGRDISVIRKWRRPTGGTRGLVPNTAVFDVLAGADAAEVVLTADDWFPEILITYDK